MILDDAGGHGAEEVTQHIEGGLVVVSFGIDAHIGAKTDVHKHQTDGGTDAQTYAQRDGVHDLVADVEHAQQQEHDALHQNDAQHRLKGAGVVGVQHGGHVAGDHGKEAVQPHAGCHNEGLVGQKSHAHRADGAGDAGGQENAVPKRGANGEVGQQIGVQGDDVRHGHEGGQTGKDLRFDGGAVFLQVEDALHMISLSFIDCWHALNSVPTYLNAPFVKLQDFL